MQLNKKIIPLYINGDEYIATVDVKTIVHYKKENKTGFLQDVQKVSEMDELIIIQLLASMIRKSEKSAPVGMNFFNSFNPIAIIEHFSPVLVEVLGANMPEADGESEKK